MEKKLKKKFFLQCIHNFSHYHVLIFLIIGLLFSICNNVNDLTRSLKSDEEIQAAALYNEEPI